MNRDLEKELYDIEPLWHVPFWQTKQFLWILIGIGVLLVALIVFFILKKWYSKKRVQLPWERALAQLAVLEKNKYVSTVHGKEFYGELTRILKEYIHDRYQIDVIHATDEELLIILEKQSELPSVLYEQARDLMDGMAFIKFANVQAAQKKIEEDFERTGKIIKETIPKKP
jgi:hypothetical protein